jgi:3-dehydroquinate dehydratase
MISISAPTAQCVIMGIGAHGYILGLEAALHLISRKAG